MVAMKHLCTQKLPVKQAHMFSKQMLGKRAGGKNVDLETAFSMGLVWTSERLQLGKNQNLH